MALWFVAAKQSQGPLEPLENRPTSKESAADSADNQSASGLMVAEKESEKTSNKDSLDLSNKGLSKVPEYVFSRTELTELNLSGNRLTGALPGEIRHLTKLRKLDASDNQMTGVPAEVGQLNNLEELDLSNNQLTGLPLELGNLKNLQVIDLSGNDYSTYDLGLIKENWSNVNIIGEKQDE